MIIYIDTNVIIDLLAKREQFYEDAYNLFTEIKKDKFIVAYTSVKSITDIYYILHKYTHDKLITSKAIVDLISVLYIANNSDTDLLKSFSSKVNDFEDSLLDELAARNHIDYIITRNIKDFTNSKVKALTPKQFLDMLKLPELSAE